MEGLRRLLSYTRRAVDDYQMIQEGDKIAVGVSAGKDSLALLYTLANLQRFYPKPFQLVAVTIDMGFEGSDFSTVNRLCEELNVPYFVKKTEIAKIVFDIRKEPNPCSLCAKLRRGILNETAKQYGANKVALGHHFDDVVETFMMNLFFEGRIGTFSPVTYLDRSDITLIRPFIYVPEKDVRYFAKRAALPVIKSPCPADGNTERERIKRLLADLEKANKGLKHRILTAIQKGNVDGYFERKIKIYKD